MKPFGAVIKKVPSSEMNISNLDVYTALRRIFGFLYWPSICQIQKVYGYHSIEALYLKAQKQFLDGILLIAMKP